MLKLLLLTSNGIILVECCEERDRQSVWKDLAWWGKLGQLSK